MTQLTIGNSLLTDDGKKLAVFFETLYHKNILIDDYAARSYMATVCKAGMSPLHFLSTSPELHSRLWGIYEAVSDHQFMEAVSDGQPATDRLSTLMDKARALADSISLLDNEDNITDMGRYVLDGIKKLVADSKISYRQSPASTEYIGRVINDRMNERDFLMKNRHLHKDIVRDYVINYMRSEG